MSTSDSRSETNDSFAVPVNRSLGILLISVLGLFIEMMIIRWLGTEIRIFAYLQNTILLVCFLGIGLGLWTSRHPIRIHQSFIPLAMLVLLLAIPIVRDRLNTLAIQLSRIGDFVVWGSETNADERIVFLLVPLALLLTYFLMILTVDVFVPIGRVLGRLMDDHPKPILAYSMNLAGSLAGTWLFVLLSSFFLPPIAWVLVCCALFLFFLPKRVAERRLAVILLAVILIASWFAGQVPDALSVVWSPYQKLVVTLANMEKGAPGKYLVTVNNTGYQVMTDLLGPATSLDHDLYPPALQGLSQYDIPLLLHPDPKSYLIVGAGAGNDVAGGLRHKVPSITAVEIDPAIIRLGKQYHPEQPYSSPTVRVVNDDARSYFETSRDEFDVIAFGLLDSHTTTAMTNARLDHYVYTKESIARAKDLLAPHGVMVLSFEAQKPFIADRMATVLRDVFGEEPLAFRMPPSGYGWGGAMFVAGDLAAARAQIAGNPRLDSLISTLQEMLPLGITHTTKITTDDWPYIYLESPGIPPLYFVLAGLMALVVFRSYRGWGAKGVLARWDGGHWHFFFLGAAFLLLEVQNISKASVVLGNTWQVNAVIVSGVLVMALIANLIAYRWPRLPISIPYAALIATCVGLYFIDLAQFAFLPYPTKAILVGALMTLPMLFSGIIFTRSFATAVHKDEALGANMLGSVAGALLQSLTFVMGIKALLLVVAGLYILSLLTRPRIYRRACQHCTLPRRTAL